MTTVSSDTLLNEVLALFRENDNLISLPVVDHGLPVGILRQARVLSSISSSPYGRELHGKKPVRLFMDSQPLIVEHDNSVEQVSQQLTDHFNFEFESEFFITRNGYYLGLGRVRDLLRTITELQLRNARHANPLTQLPGNIVIDEQMERVLSAGDDFAVAYCDLDYFKPFNDHFGYKYGDEVIRMVARLLNSHIDGERDFVGHIGGDDFIVILQSRDWQLRLQTILDNFRLEIQEFFDRETLVRGGYDALDRSGKSNFIPLTSLSIGVVRPDTLACSTIHDISTMASDAKKMAKKMHGNSLYIDRRRSPSRYDIF